MEISDQIAGMSKAFDQYLQGNVKNEQETQQYQAKSNIDLQQAENLSTFKQKQEGIVTPDMGKQLFSVISPEFGDAAQKAISEFKQAKGRDMTAKESTEFMDPIIKGLSLIQAKGMKNTTKHYMGNDPEGNAIFGDSNGKMYSPDGSLYDGKVLPKSSTMPTFSTRSSGEFATTILPHITDMRQLIQEADAKGFIGPASGRIYNQFLAGKIGSTGNEDADMLLGKLRAMDALLKTGAMRVHFGSRGGQNMYEHFSDMLNTGKQSAAVLNGSLDTMESFMKGYANAGSLNPDKGQPDLAAQRAEFRKKHGI